MNHSDSITSRLLVIATLLCSSAAAQAQAGAPTRGQLLYTTHCIACHSTQMHWRNDRQAKDWDSLKLQVRRWQGNAGLRWNDADITDVARHLNDTIYHFAAPEGPVGMASPVAPGSR